MQTLENVIKQCRGVVFRHHRDQRGVRQHLNALAKSHLGPMPVEHLTAADIHGLVDDMINDQAADGTVVHRIAKLNRVLSYAYDRGLRTQPPPKVNITRHTRQREYEISVEVEAQMAQALAQRGAKFVHLFNFLLYTAARYSEATKLTWSHVTDSHVTFLASTVKTNKTRTLPLFPPAAEAIRFGRDHYANDAGPFAWAQDHHVFYRAWRPAKKAIGLQDEKDFVPHACRHTCITRLAREGMSTMSLQQWGGWTSLAMLERYSHLEASRDLSHATARYAIDRSPR